MKWQHKCSLKWLNDRKNYLSASEIKQLVPFTKTGRPRKVTDEDYLAVYARKIVRSTEDDCWSYGDMARGHLLEPYAIDSWNACCISTKLYHWDDEVISTKGLHHLGFSPDALNIAQGGDITKATTIGEVKSYSPANHLKCGMTKAKELEERWQIATAMAVLESLDTGYLIFYNPDFQEPMLQLLCRVYTRVDLKDEIEAILKVEERYAKLIDSFTYELHYKPTNPLSCIMARSTKDIRDIEKEIEASQRLNPTA